jgi:hypothetical protein
MPSVVDPVQRIVQDLLNLEIDIIIKPGMTARKMPDASQALLDIVGLYDAYLCQSGNTLNPVWDQHGRIPIQVRPSAETKAPQSANRQTDPATGRLTKPLITESVPDVISENTFDMLRERAVEAEAVYRRLVGELWLKEDERGIILTRIYRNCDQIKAMVSRPEMKTAIGDGVDRDRARSAVLPVSSDEMVTLRKVWEIGVESVVMQTVIQLDGDIITRIQRGQEVASNKPLHDLHQEAVGNALRHWQFLAQTVAQFLTSTLRSFFLQ